MFDEEKKNEKLIEYYELGYNDAVNNIEVESIFGIDDILMNSYRIGAVHGKCDPNDEFDEPEHLASYSQVYGKDDDLIFVLDKKEGLLLQAMVQHYSDEEILKADGLDEAVIGIDVNSMRLVYSAEKAILIFARDMKYTQAIEYFEYNTECAYMGEKTPIWCHSDYYL